MTASARAAAVAAFTAQQEAQEALRKQRDLEQRQREAQENEEALDIALSCPLLADWFPDVVWSYVDHRGLSGPSTCVIRSVEPNPLYLIVIRDTPEQWRILLPADARPAEKHPKWLVGATHVDSAADIGKVIADRERFARSVAEVKRVQETAADD